MIDHIETRKDITNIMADVRRIAKFVVEYNTKVGNINANTNYTPEGKAKKLETLTEPFKKEIEKWYETVKTELETIKAREMEFSEILEPSEPLLKDCVELIKNTNGVVDIEKIVDMFKGNMQALKIIRIVFGQCVRKTENSIQNLNDLADMPYSFEKQKRYIDKYIFDVEAELETLINEAGMAVYAVESANRFMIEFSKDLIATGELLGLEFDDNEKETGLDTEAYDRAFVLRAMGIPEDEIEKAMNTQ
ncbi:MAG: hypothetical protein IKD83_01705 [Firmicutes bacterium]|nr:hypothetical protein [Bacillota bacterium]